MTMHNMKRLRAGRFGALAVCMSLIAPVAAQAAPCTTRTDRTALEVRLLQTELMVAALTCNQRTDYNAFITRFQPQLTAQGKHLQSFFKQSYQAGATKKLNDFVTRVANESARRGMVKRGAFCRSASRIHADSKLLSPAELPALASLQSFTDSHGVSPCATQVAQKPPAPEPAGK